MTELRLVNRADTVILIPSNVASFSGGQATSPSSLSADIQNWPCLPLEELYDVLCHQMRLQCLFPVQLKWREFRTSGQGPSAGFYILAEFSNPETILFFEKEAGSEPGSWLSLQPTDALLIKAKFEFIYHFSQNRS